MEHAAVAAHLDALKELGQESTARADVAVLRYDPHARTRRDGLRFVGLGALMGKKTTSAKADAARRNGRKGGRPRKATVGTRS